MGTVFVQMKKRSVLRIVKRALSGSKVRLFNVPFCTLEIVCSRSCLWLSEDVNQDGDGLIVDKGQLKIIMH